MDKSIATGHNLGRHLLWVRTAVALALATLGVFVAFGAHIVSGGAYEMRTVIAMVFRSGIWLAIAAIGWRAVLRQRLDELMQLGT